MPLREHRLKFANSVGRLGLIEGSLQLSGDHINLELAMTESITGFVSHALNYAIPLADIESVVYKSRLFLKPRITLTSYRISTFQRIPHAQGFDYVFYINSSNKAAQSFARAVKYRMMELETQQLDKRYDQLNKG